VFCGYYSWFGVLRKATTTMINRLGTIYTTQQQQQQKTETKKNNNNNNNSTTTTIVAVITIRYCLMI